MNPQTEKSLTKLWRQTIDPKSNTANNSVTVAVRKVMERREAVAQLSEADKGLVVVMTAEMLMMMHKVAKRLDCWDRMDAMAAIALEIILETL